MTNAEALRIYAKHEAAISKIWLENPGYRMTDAVLHWQKQQKGYSVLYGEMTSLYKQYRDLGNSRIEARRKVRQQLHETYGKDGRIWKIIIQLLPLLFLFL